MARRPKVPLLKVEETKHLPPEQQAGLSLGLMAAILGACGDCEMCACDVIAQVQAHLAMLMMGVGPGDDIPDNVREETKELGLRMIDTVPEGTPVASVVLALAGCVSCAGHLVDEGEEEELTKARPTLN